MAELTNDLDTETPAALKDALESDAGCAVIISHERIFLDRLATHILSFEGDSHVEWFEGNFEDCKGQGPPHGSRRAHAAPHDVQAADKVGTIVCPASIAYRSVMEAAMLTVRLPVELEERLEAVARKVGRSKHDVAMEAIIEEIGDLEDGFLALERLNSGDAEFYTLEEVRERLGLTD